VAGIAGLILTQGGCSIYGLITGLQHDARKPEGGAYPGWQWVTLTEGTEVTVRMTDGTKLKGTLMSVDQLLPISTPRIMPSAASSIRQLPPCRPSRIRSA